LEAKKQRVMLRINYEDKTHYTEAILHPQGYMKAKYTHLDIPADKAPEILVDLSRIRGIRIPCRFDDNCIILVISGLSTIRICVENYRIMCREHVWLSKKKDGMIYVGPIKASSIWKKDVL